MSPDSTVPDNVLVAGVTQSKKLIKSSSVKIAYVASDAEQKITGMMADICREFNVELDNSYTLEQLGRMCGIDVNCAACVLLK
ncbi:MAG: ribosomal L7Ae/L30e/S12e/Gadd45 family protein [Clostridiales bacterium]|nr:ribosomal L7Ae/L30e/S12e/Gadd45 family protein [Clostridiales bacterium]